MRKLSVLILGAGGRGRTYAHCMGDMPDRYEIVGVGEPVEGRRRYIADTFGVPAEHVYDSWRSALAVPKFADVCVISTMDEEHYEPALRAIELGYDILLEKPIAQTVEQCAEIAAAANKKGVKVIVCHVLRYTSFYKTVKSVLDSGRVGQVMSVMAAEAVGHIHQSHSFVRGNWHSEEETTPMLIAKSCHDMDIIQWLIGRRCKKVSSFGQLTYFTPDYAPEGAPVRCIDGGCPIEDTCVYNCKKLYYDDKNNMWFRRSSTRGIAAGDIPTDEEVMQALQTTDYGLCVYHANNDVVDHQVVNMEFDGGATCCFSMCAFNSGGRYIRIFGTGGELRAFDGEDHLDFFPFEKRDWVQIPLVTDDTRGGNHGGGDRGIVYDLSEYLNGTYNGCSVADISISTANHLIGFAAERARHTDTVVDVDRFFEEYGLKNE